MFLSQLLGLSLSLDRLVPDSLRLPGQLLGLSFIIEGNISNPAVIFHLLSLLSGLLSDHSDLRSETLAGHNVG